MDWSWGKSYFQQDRKMVRDAARIAGAGVSAEGLFAGMGGITGKEKRDAEDPHGGSTPGGRYISMVYKFPFSVEFYCPLAPAKQFHMQRSQGWLQHTEDRVVGSIVEIATGNNPVDADGCE